MSKGSAAPDRKFSEYVGVHLPPSLYERVQADARRVDRTVSSWLRQAMRAKLDEENAAPEQTAPAQ